MTSNQQQQPNRERLLDLADLMFAGDASADDIEQLEAMLLHDPDARREYLRYAMVHGQLGLTSAGLPAADLPDEALARALASQRTLVTVADPGVAPAKLLHKPSLGRMALIALSLVAVVLIGVSIWPLLTKPADQQAVGPNDSLLAERTEKQHGNQSDTSHYDTRDLPIGIVAMLSPTTAPNAPSRAISPLTVKIDRGETRLTSASGADVRVQGPATFGVNSPSGGVLFDGSVHTRLTDPDATFSVLISNLRVVDLGTEFRVTVVDDSHVRVHVLDGEVDIQSRVRLPLYYWSFDSPQGVAVDQEAISKTPFTLGGATRRVEGIIGSGALAFDNSNASFLRVEGGTGEKIGMGRLACSSGITIEAMFVSRWTGGFKDYDEIYRKEDGNNRVLLSFQNDGNLLDYDLPDVAPGPCLSFGLNLEQHGYSELDMPLDGRDGRPSVADLTDGMAHHVVATYDSFTGRKAIYIDGQLCFVHAFPVGTLILSGGPVPANIGSMEGRHEPFNGILDEVAYYDFALTASEIASHYRNASSGKTYFGVHARDLPSDRWQSVTHLTKGMTRVFNKTTGLAARGAGRG